MNHSPFILVIDDHKETREALCYYLNEAGYRTENAGSVADAIVAAKRLLPDLIITDLVMPGHDQNILDLDQPDGIELIKVLQSDVELKSIPVILCTAAWTDVKAVNAAYKLQIVDLILKPITDLGLLLTAVSNIVGPPIKEK